MEGFIGRKGLIEPKRLRTLNQRSDLRGFLQAGSHFGAIAVTGIMLASTWGSWWAVPVFLVHGVLINFLYAGQHELSHSTVFKTRWLNEVTGRIIGFAMIYPRDFDQIQHFAHHRHTQDWDRDGELQRKPYTLASYLMWFLGPTYWYTRVRRMVRFAFGLVEENYVRQDERLRVIREARLHLLGYGAIAAVSIAVGSWAAVALWLAPMLVAKPVHQLQNTIEHLGLTHDSNILENTRTVRTNAVLRWLCWNMQFHTAHHTFPSVPFHRLPDLHGEIVSRTGVTPHTMGYLAFQRDLIGKLARGSEDFYPDDEPWVGFSTDRAAA